MKVIVAIKRVIDYHVKPSIKKDGSDVDLANVKMAMNPFCEIAVEEAVRLKESHIATEVIVVSVGTNVCQQQLRTALAMGADRGILVETSSDQVSSLGVAQILHAIVKKEKPDLIILGKQSIDIDNNQTGQALAALANIGQSTFTSKITVNTQENTVETVREVDGGLQTLALKLPAVITTDLRLNEPRNIPLPNIMKAKSKPLEVISLDQLGVQPVKTLHLKKVEPPKKRQAGIVVDNVDALLEKLNNEAKVI